MVKFIKHVKVYPFSELSVIKAILDAFFRTAT